MVHYQNSVLDVTFSFMLRNVYDGLCNKINSLNQHQKKFIFIVAGLMFVVFAHAHMLYSFTDIIFLLIGAIAVYLTLLCLLQI